jgi:hypothetical protein
VFGHKSAYFRTYFKNKSVLETLQLGGAMPNLFSKRIGLAPKMGIFYSTIPPNLPSPLFRPLQLPDPQLKGHPKPMLGIINLTPRINYMAIIAMQGHRVNIRKYPCIARSVLSGHAIAHYSSPLTPSAQSNHDGTHRRLFWLPYLHHLSNSTHQTFKTSPSTFNVNGDSPRIAIAAPVFFHISHCVTDTRDHEIRQSDHFDCLPFIEYCLRNSHPVTHAL